MTKPTSGKEMLITMMNALEISDPHIRMRLGEFLETQKRLAHNSGVRAGLTLALSVAKNAEKNNNDVRHDIENLIKEQGE